MGSVVCLFSLIGTYTYRHYASAWTYRRLVMLSSLLACLVHLMDILVYSRLNLAFGLPDGVFVLGLSACQNVLESWMGMPIIIVNSQFCPPGMEASLYALLSGIGNIGATIRHILGAWLLEVLQCKPDGGVLETAQFDNLWLAAAISAAVSLLPLLLAPWLVPDVTQAERLIPDSSTLDATAGSPWRCWRGISHVPESYTKRCSA